MNDLSAEDMDWIENWAKVMHADDILNPANKGRFTNEAWEDCPPYLKDHYRKSGQEQLEAKREGRSYLRTSKERL